MFMMMSCATAITLWQPNLGSAVWTGALPFAKNDLGAGLAEAHQATVDVLHDDILGSVLDTAELVSNSRLGRCFCS